MIIDITEKCSMECSHCMSSCTKDGQHMSEKIFNDSLDFIMENNIAKVLLISGGEPTEHPRFEEFMHILLTRYDREQVRSMVTITTNGFWCLDHINVAKDIAKGSNYVTIQWQVSTDKRFYPRELPTHKRLWKEPGFTLCEDCVVQVYPQGRALDNNLSWEAKASKCFNIRAISKQLRNPTVESVIQTLIDHLKFCTPTIRIDGSIGLGESRLCPSVATIYDTSEEIIEKIQKFQCHKCDHINNNLSPLYKLFL